jgi:hypothetical protein
MQPERITANGSCHMSRDIVWLSDRGRPGSLIWVGHRCARTSSNVIEDAWIPIPIVSFPSEVDLAHHTMPSTRKPYIEHLRLHIAWVRIEMKIFLWCERWGMAGVRQRGGGLVVSCCRFSNGQHSLPPILLPLLDIPSSLSSSTLLIKGPPRSSALWIVINLEHGDAHDLSPVDATDRVVQGGVMFKE